MNRFIFEKVSVKGEGVIVNEVQLVSTVLDKLNQLAKTWALQQRCYSVFLMC